MTEQSDAKPAGGKAGFRKVLIPVVLLAVGAGIAAKLVFFRGTFLYAGTLESTKVDLSAQVPSTIKAVQVQEGALVKQGDELVALSCEDIKVADDLANLNYERTLRLRKSGSATQEALDQAKNRKDDADVRLSWCSIRSPIGGTVLSRYHEPGEWVSPGVKLLTLANIRDIWAYVYVPQPEIVKLKVGEKLVGTLPELPGREFIGHVVKINEEAEFTPKNVQTAAERTRLVFGVKVSFLGSNEDESLKPGMTIEVKLP